MSEWQENADKAIIFASMDQAGVPVVFIENPDGRATLKDALILLGNVLAQVAANESRRQGSGMDETLEAMGEEILRVAGEGVVYYYINGRTGTDPWRK